MIKKYRIKGLLDNGYFDGEFFSGILYSEIYETEFDVLDTIRNMDTPKFGVIIEPFYTN